ncbi:MAG TPA: MucR family transcriptional regulator [Sphingobium sp.]
MVDDNLLTLTADIVAAHVSNNSVAVAELPNLIGSVFDALTNLLNPGPVSLEKATPAVSVRTSIKPDYLVCLEDGKKLTMLKRYLSRNFNLSPDEYRAKWNLPKDYPMVAPNYAERRRALALSIGLGRKSATKAEIVADVVPEPSTGPVKSGRKKLGISGAKAGGSEAAASGTQVVETVAEPTVRRRGKAAK